MVFTSNHLKIIISSLSFFDVQGKVSFGANDPAGASLGNWRDIAEVTF